MIVVRSSQWSSSSLVLLLLSPSCLLLVTPEARISIPANERMISSWPPPSDAAGRILAIQFHPLRGPSVVRLRYTIPYHRTESSTKAAAAAAAQLLLVEYCNTQVSTLSSAECLIARAAPWGQRWVQSTHGRPRKHSLGYIHSPFR